MMVSLLQNYLQDSIFLMIFYVVHNSFEDDSDGKYDKLILVLKMKLSG